MIMQNDKSIEQDLVAAVTALYPGAECRETAPRRVEVKLPAERLYEFASRMRDLWDFAHLSAISCVDWIDDGEFELVYHFWSYSRKVLLSAKVRIPRGEEPHFESISNLWQAAKFFERDIHEFFGIVFDGCEDLGKFILTDWDGPPPMRKDFITREYALNHFHYMEYNPDWLKELMEKGQQQGAKDES